VPHYFTVRGIYETASLTDAVQAVRRAHRAIPANVILVTPQGPADLEVTIDHVHVIEDGGDGVVTHTNHCEHPDLLSINDDYPELIQSGPRKVRVERILGELARPFAIEGLKETLRDHENYPTSICRHPNDHPTTGYWATTFSVIIEPESGLLHASRGTPCTQPYETYSLN
jgi:isopenicillin-N N-acyltransferase-like protein